VKLTASGKSTAASSLVRISPTPVCIRLTGNIAFWALYFLCSAIRSNVGLAQTMNSSAGHDLQQVLHLTAKETSTALALFYVAYVVFDFPSNLIMTRLSPRVWMSRIVFAVGIIGACFAAVEAAWSLL
jgi:fucose permease